MSETIPIKLLLDANLRVEAGKNQVMSWAVLNAHPAFEVANLSLTAERNSVDCHLDGSGWSTKIEPGKLARIGQAMRVQEPGKYPIRLRVSGAMRGGQRFDLISDDLTLVIHTDGVVTINGGAGGVLVPGDIKADTLRIVTDGVVQLRGKVEAKNIRIDGQGGVILAEGLGDGSSESSEATNFRSFGMNEAVEISLHRVVVEGLEALDLQKIAAKWPGCSDESVSVSFVDEHGSDIDNTLKAFGIYRLRIESSIAGFVHLFTRASEGGFNQLAPSNRGNGGFIQPGSTLYFPGDVLLPLPQDDLCDERGEQYGHLQFTVCGVEQVLVVVSPTPGDRLELFCPVERHDLINLLERLSHTTPSVAGYAKVTVR